MIAEILSAWRELAVEDSSMKIIEGCIKRSPDYKKG